MNQILPGLNLLFLSVTRFFLFVSQNKIYIIRIKKQNVLYDWVDVFCLFFDSIAKRHI